jgi:hypothetical protein
VKLASAYIMSGSRNNVVCTVTARAGRPRLIPDKCMNIFFYTDLDELLSPYSILTNVTVVQRRGHEAGHSLQVPVLRISGARPPITRISLSRCA